MSSDSDSEDDIKMKQFLEAADTTLLNNSMFQKKEETIIETEISPKKDIEEPAKKDLPKSQRYIAEDNENAGTDFNLPESMQKHLAKKLNEILKEHYEFYDVNTEEIENFKVKTKYKNRVKLLKGDECCVKPYEDFEYEIRGPKKKPEIKKRIVDQTDVEINEEYKLKVAVDGNYILSGVEIKSWANKRERKDKVFHYKLASTGVLHAKEEVNEFTELRKKNKWNESKINKFKRCK